MALVLRNGAEMLDEVCAVCCSVVHCVAVCCSVLQCEYVWRY